MNIHRKIVKFIEKERVITSSELSDYLSVSWNTAERHLLELALEGEVERYKKKGVNIWLLKQ